MRTTLYVNCPKCGYEYRFKISVPNNGFNEIAPSFDCKCGAKVMLSIKIGNVYKAE